MEQIEDVGLRAHPAGDPGGRRRGQELHREALPVQHVRGQVQEHGRGPVQPGVRPGAHHAEGGHPGHGRRHAVPGDAAPLHRHGPRLPAGLRRHLGPVLRVHQAVLRGGARAARGLPGHPHRGGREQARPDRDASRGAHRGRLRVGVLRAAQTQV